MAAHLERHAGVRAVVNLVPVLLDQLEDYADQFATGALRDPLLRLLARDESTPLSPRRARARRRPVLPREPREDGAAVPALQGPARSLPRARAPGPRRDRLSLRPLLPRPRDLVSPRVDGGDGQARVRARDAHDGGRDGVHCSRPAGALRARRRDRLAARSRATRGSPRAGASSSSTTPHYHPLAPLLHRFPLGARGATGGAAAGERRLSRRHRPRACARRRRAGEPRAALRRCADGCLAVRRRGLGAARRASSPSAAAGGRRRARACS